MKRKSMKGADRCPRCGSRKIRTIHQNVVSFYAHTIAVCGNCDASWEPFDPADLLDQDDPHSSFKEPCDNCAFRPGSTEQQDTEEWKKTMAALKAGGQFFCHKGVPMTPGKGHGFAYPERTVVAEMPGIPPTETKVYDRRRMHLCRGYLHMLRKQLDEQKETA